MTTNSAGCGCGPAEQDSVAGSTVTEETGQAQTATVRPGLVNRKVILLMSAGAAIAAGCEPCLRRIVPQLQEIGASDDDIRGAIYTGQMVKDASASIMKQVADEIAGADFSEVSDLESCPADMMQKDDKYRVTMLIAASAAMAANCEFCLNRIIPDLIEAGVSEADMRKAVEVGQFIKDKPAGIMKEAADVLTGTRLSEKPAAKKNPEGRAKQGGGCCG